VSKVPNAFCQFGDTPATMHRRK